ncbi:DUF262 domain-containing protein [Aquimarina sp. I32.4]|uniref:DUF262 domain-containing protein n=1 Tax=Aquimarina sp. I32.4 TaxID=2053903 RepID=UPI000CDEB950|nr:DUF262 domain-containing protein [Aquimarina sp. I32.4]
MEIREIFENRIKIEPKVMSIEVLFNNPERVENTNYKPFYQRNYVWDDEKATYFIESILLGTEIPPLIFFRNLEKIEIIDGRQRYQTVLRFIKNEFKLKKNGLHKLNNIDISGKYFKDLERDLQDLFWETKLRIIEFSFYGQNAVDEDMMDMEDVVKKEIFKRYNSGITPLKPTEIDNAIYIDDDLNSFFKQKLIDDQILKRDISDALNFEKTTNEIILKKIRQLLVQHKIPIKYYAVKKNIVIANFYEFSFSDIDEAEIHAIFNKFIEKINLISKVKIVFPGEGKAYNRLISECLFWVFSILENENISLSLITNDTITKLTNYIYKNIESFDTTRGSFAKELFKRYEVISHFFTENFKVDFNIYLHNNIEFKTKNKEIIPDLESVTSFDDLRIHKTEPSSITIVDIVRQMSKQRFLIRPPYQRQEVINKKKSSSIIESILLGIKLPPIFIYKRKDGVSEVLDGQQRLLSILGFINESYLDENNKIRHSDKNAYSLNLKNGILRNLHLKKFEQLSSFQKSKINNFDLWIIEINYKNNINFEPIDLFLRLNNKPYPIKEDTFEMWNSYISRDIILTIQSIYKNNDDWFYFRKNNSRMENENIYTSLIYLQYTWIIAGKPANFIPNDIGIYQVVDRIMFRLKSKIEITKVLENTSKTTSFIGASNDFEFNFIKKLRVLVSDSDDSSTPSLIKNLEEILIVVKGRRTQQTFYALWYFLFDIPFDVIDRLKSEIRNDLKSLFKDMAGIESKEVFHSNISKFKSKYIQSNLFLNNSNYQFVEKTLLGNISTISQGVAINKNIKPNSIKSELSYPYFEKGDFNNFQINKEDISYLEDVSMFNKDFFNLKNKILVKRNLTSNTRFNTSYFDSNLIFKPNTIGIVVNRYGFDVKYILAILSSRYCYNFYYLKNVNENDELKNITLTEIKDIEIPIIPFEKQLLFSKIIDYVLNSKTDSESTLFFERLVDAMVYELYFQVQFEKADIKISSYLNDLPEIEDDTNLINSIYKSLSDPNNDLNISLLKILNISEIINIENQF